MNVSVRSPNRNVISMNEVSASITTASTSHPIFKAFRNLRAWIENPKNIWEIELEGQVQYHLRVANTATLRRQAFRLGRNIYSAAEYTSVERDFLCSNFDIRKNTLVLLICDKDNHAVGTASVVGGEEDRGLPVDETFPAETERLRKSGKRLAEVVRFAIAPSMRNTHSRELLIHLLNFSFIYAKHVLACDGFLVTVNPSHLLFYERLLGYQRLGSTKACPKVLGAPAALMYLCFEYATARLRREAGRMPSSRKKRSLYPSLFIEEAEPIIAAWLQYRLQPMKLAEAQELGLSPQVIR